MSYNNKLKLDTTMLQSNTAHHLVQFIAIQRDAINKLLVDGKLSGAEIRDLSDNYEYIATKHLDALHKRVGTKIFNKDEEESKYGK